MKNWKILSILLVAAMATACGTDTDDGGNTATDSGATGQDATAGSDAGATSTDTKAGPTCLPSPYTPTANDKFGKGCSQAADLGYLDAMAKDAKKGDTFRALITSCLLTEGCSGKGDAKTPEGTKLIEDCTAKCILDKAEAGIGADCAHCYAINGTCGFTKCIGKCAVDSGSQGCKDCMACNCDAILEACRQLPTK